MLFRKSREWHPHTLETFAVQHITCGHNFKTGMKKQEHPWVVASEGNKSCNNIKLYFQTSASAYRTYSRNRIRRVDSKFELIEL